MRGGYFGEEVRVLTNSEEKAKGGGKQVARRKNFGTEDSQLAGRITYAQLTGKMQSRTARPGQGRGKRNRFKPRRCREPYGLWACGFVLSGSRLSEPERQPALPEQNSPPPASLRDIPVSRLYPTAKQSYATAR
jgi:hypothetical protein